MFNSEIQHVPVLCLFVYKYKIDVLYSIASHATKAKKNLKILNIKFPS